MWSDVYQGCTLLYYQLFYYMEEIGLLDIEDEIQLFCLHYVFLPRINNSLREFMTTWNHHPLSTKSNRSPLQLWMTGEHPSDEAHSDSQVCVI